MKKLRNKTFILIFSILTSFSIIILFISNYQVYQKEKNVIKDNLFKISNVYNNFDFINRPVFLDYNVYVVNFDYKGNIKNILNYTSEEISEDKIIYLTQKFLKTKKTYKIGNLYVNIYSYFLTKNSLIILNNSIARSKLISYLNISILLLLLIEMIIFYVSYVLTKWLVKPVIEAFDKQKEFIYDASHELKTPIAVILANAEMLENEPNEKKWLINIKDESNRMSKLVSDLLELSKSENNVNSNVYKNQNISKIIEKSVLTFEGLVYENKLELKSEIQKNIYLKCDDDKIKQLLTILIDNAIKHSYKNSDIVVSLFKDKNNIILKVKNKGEEIPVEERQKIFERFYKSDKSRNRNENRYGLGLAIAKNIVNIHNGNIFVECNDGYTTFIINFKQVN